MKLKKLFSTLTAAAIMVSSLFCFSVPASAKDGGMDLIKVPTSQVFSSATFEYLGDGVYITDDGFYRIGRDEMSKWRSSGKLKATKLKSNFSIPKRWEIVGGGFDDGGYVCLYGKDKDGHATSYSVIKYNKSKGAIESYYNVDHAVNSGVYSEETFNTSEGRNLELIGTAYNGYIVKPSFNSSGKKCTVTVTTPNGKKFTNKIDNYIGGICIPSYDEKYVYFTADYIKKRKNYTDPDRPIFTARLIAVDSKGKQTVLRTFDATYFELFNSYSAPSNRTLFYYHTVPGDKTPKPYMYLIDENRVITLADVTNDKTGAAFNGDEKTDGIISNISYTNNNKSIAHFKPEGNIKSGAYGYYKLISVNSGKAIFFTDEYEKMCPANNIGDIYYARSFDGECVYFETATGRKCGSFDQASTFNGRYAAVKKDGWFYLIDGKMSRVTERVDGIDVFEDGRDYEGLFRGIINGRPYFITYADSGEKPDTPTNFDVSVSGKKLNITWDTSEVADGYIIYYSTSKNGNYKKLKTIKSGDTNSVTVSSLKKGSYYINIRSYRTYKKKTIYSGTSHSVNVTIKK